MMYSNLCIRPFASLYITVMPLHQAQSHVWNLCKPQASETTSIQFKSVVDFFTLFANTVKPKVFNKS